MKFLNTAFGSWLKVFATAALTLIVANGSVKGLDYIHVIDAALISTLPVIINALNPTDKRYGKTK
jgi:hypothetical protein